MKTKRTSFPVFLVTAFFLGATNLFGGVINQVGVYNNWATNWTPIAGLINDADDNVNDECDIVGDSLNPAAYWAYRDDYIFFRQRVAYSTAITTSDSDFEGAHFVLIDIKDYLYDGSIPGDFTSDDPFMPDFGIAWDSKSDSTTRHGLEMLVISTRDNIWNGINMDDIDGSAGDKLVNDIGGVDGARTTDGYVRTVDLVSTTNFGMTAFIDFAVSWEYLETYTDLRKGQDWNLALASIENATDHNNLGTDIGGGANPGDSNTAGWAAVPEPATMSLIGLFGFMLLIGRRVIGK